MTSKTKRISLNLPENVYKALEKETRQRNKTGKRVTGPTILRDIVTRHLLGSNGSPAEKMQVYHDMMKEVLILKDTVVEELSRKSAKSRKPALKAAALKIQALSLMEKPSEEVTLKILIGVVFLLKCATGYKRLPDGVSTNFPKDSIETQI